MSRRTAGRSVLLRSFREKEAANMSRRTAAFPKIKMKIREKEAANMSRRTADETLSQQISAYTRRGLYRKKIFRVFFAISFVFILCFLILVSSFFFGGPAVKFAVKLSKRSNRA